MPVFADRVKVTTATTGTGTLTLGAPVDRFQSFADGGVPDAAQVSYVIEDGDNIEIGTGTYSTSGPTLARTTVHRSIVAGTPGTAKLNLSGDAVVFVTARAGDFSDVARSGAYGDLSGKPSLGTAAPLNVAASGNAGIGEVVKGNDTRLSDARTPAAHGHPISNITNLQTELNGKAALASPIFTGTPTAPTPTVGDNSTKLATTAFVLANAGGAGSINELSDGYYSDGSIGIGVGALSADDGIGNASTAVGFNALNLSSNNFGNTALGYQALELASTANNTAVGYNALRSGGGRQNTAVGYTAGEALTTGQDNVAIGYQSALLSTTGSKNTAVGWRALFGLTTGINNIGIGSEAGQSSSPFNLTSQDNKIIMGNNSHTDAYIKISWTVTSDVRDKTNIEPLSLGLDFIESLYPVAYEFREGDRKSSGDGVKRYGFLAQDVLSAEHKDPVITDLADPENLKIRESYIIPVLVKAVQELSARVEKLEGYIND